MLEYVVNECNYVDDVNGAVAVGVDTKFIEDYIGASSIVCRVHAKAVVKATNSEM